MVIASAGALNPLQDNLVFKPPVKADDVVLVGFINYGLPRNLEGYSLVPLLAYKDGKYHNFKQELKHRWNEKKESEEFIYPEKAKKVLQAFLNSKFWLYHQGSLVGEFKATGQPILDSSFLPSLYFSGEVSWKISSTEIEDSNFKIVALSQPIPQPFWPKGLSLTSTQSESLRKIIDQTFYAVCQQFHIKRRRLIGRGATIEVMDLDQDGQPEVYFMADRDYIESCNWLHINRLFSWKNNHWTILLKGDYYRYIVPGDPEIKVEETGEGRFFLFSRLKLIEMGLLSLFWSFIFRLPEPLMIYTV